MKKVLFFFTTLMLLCLSVAVNAQSPVLYEENFDGMSSESDLTAAGWISYGASGCYIGIDMSYSTSGSNSLLISAWKGINNSDSEVAGLPVLSVPINTLQITLSYCQRSGGIVKVGYLTDPDDASTFVSLQNLSSSTSAFNTVTVDLSNAPANAARIAIQQYTWYECYIDDIEVKALPTCMKPQNLAVTLTPGNGSVATLTWQRHANGTEDAWVLEYCTNPNFTDATSVNVTGGTPSKELTTLTAETKYYARVKADCGGDESEWSNPISFTPTDAYTLSLNEGSGNNYYVPIYYSYISYSSLNTASQFIIPASDLNSIQWANIEKLTFYANTATANYGNAEFTVYAGETAATTQTSFTDWNTLTEVYTGSVSVNNNMMEITFDNPFSYTTGNLLIGIKITTAGTNPSSFSWKGVSGPTSGVSLYSGYSSTPSTQSFLPQVTISYTPGEAPSCLPPTTPQEVVNTASTNSVQLTWTVGASETAWDIYYTTSSSDIPDENTTPSRVNIPDNPYTLDGLTHSTHYYVYVRANCGDEQSLWSQRGEFATDCGAVTNFPWSENFESFTVNTVPLCWDNSATTGSDYSSNPEYYWGVYETNGNKMIRMYNYFAHGPLAIINSPTINLPAEPKELTFNYTHNANSGAFSVKISENGGTTFTELKSYTKGSGSSNSDPGTFTEATISLADYTNKSVILQFYSAATFGNGAIFVDNIRIDNQPTCLKPSALMLETPSSRTAHTATLNWTNGEEGQNAWQIAYSTNSSFAPAPDFVPNGTTEWLADVYSTPATIEGLAQSTTYYAYVRANCGNGDYSAWNTTKLTFATLAGNAVPTGLAVAANTITSSQATASWNAVAGNTEHQSYDIYWAEATVTAVPEEPAAPNLIAGITATSQVISGLTENTDYKVWVRDNCGTDGYSNWSSAVTFHTANACQTPDGLAKNNVTNNSATISWNAYGQTGFNLRYGTDGENWTTIEDVGTSHTFSNNLTGNTTYYVQVQASCNTEAWSNTMTFTTKCDAVTTFPWREQFDERSTGNFSDLCWENEHLTVAGNYATTVFKVAMNTSSGNNTNLLQLPDQSSGNTVELRLPQMNLPNNNYQFVIDVYRSNSTYNDDYPYEGIRVFASTDGEIEGATELTFIPRQYNVSSSLIPEEAEVGWYTYEIPIGISGNCYIILRGESQYCTATYMDNFFVEQIPTCKKPSALACDSKTAHTATLSWTNGEEGQDAWQIAYSTNSSFAPADNFTPGENEWLVDVTTNPATIQGLDPNTTYYAYVRANCGTVDGVSAWNVTKINFTTNVGNAAPTDLAVNNDNITSSQATVTWNGVAANEYHDSYDIYYATSDVDEVPAEPVAPNFITGITDESKTIEGLNPATSYKVWVRDNCGNDGYSEWAGPVNFTTKASCSEPENLVVTGVTAHGAMLDWTTGQGNDGYVVEYGEIEAGVQLSVDFEDESIPADFTNSANYPWTVTSNDKHEGTYSVKSGGAGTAYASSDLKLTITLLVDGSVSFWAKASSEGGYDYGRFFIDGTQKFQTSGTSNSWTQYNYDLTAGSHTLLWRYYKDSGTDKGDDCFYVDSITIIGGAVNNWLVASNNESNVTYTFDDLDPETSYQARVKGMCGESQGGYSNVVNFTTLENCPKPTNLTLTSGSETAHGATLTWTPGSTANEHYIVEYRISNENNWNTVQNGIDETTYTFTTLDPETSYLVRVSAVCGIYTSDYSNEVEFTTLEACPAPTAVTASNVTANGATISWNGTSDSYTVSYRTAENMNVLWSEGFEDESTFTNWTRSNTSNVSRSTSAKYSDNYGVQFTYTSNPPLYLISPDVSAYTTESGLKLEFYYSNNSNIYTETFYVGFSSTNTEYESFDFGTTEYSITNQEWKRYFEDIPTGTKYIAIKYTGNNTYNMYVDDFVIGTTIPAGVWQTVNTAETSTTLTSLIPETTYEAKVQGHCANDDSAESELISFTPSCSFYQLLTDASDLAAGDKIIIAAATYDKAMSTTQKANNRDVVDITKNGNRLGAPSSTVQILTLEEGTTTGTWALNTGNGYLYAASSSNNYLKTQQEIDANASWTISVSGNMSSIVATESNNRNVMQFNSSLISCYASASQSPLAIYKFTDYRGKGPDTTHTGVVATMGDSYECMGQTFTASGDYEVLVGTSINGCDSIRILHLTLMEQVKTPTFSPAEGEYNLAQNVEISCETADATIYYTTDGSTPTAASTVYSQAITVEAGTTVTIKAIAMKEGMGNSEVATATYTVTNQEHTITFNAGTGTCTTESMTAVSIDELPTATLSETCAQQGWAFYGWSESAVANETTEAPVLVSTPYAPTDDITLFAVYSKGESQETEFNFASIATANSWTNGTQYSSVTIDPVTLTANGGASDGKYYSSDNSWRIYSSSNGSVAITSTGGNVTAVSSAPSKEFSINNGVASYTASSNTNFTAITVTTSSFTYYSNPVCLETVATPTFTLAEGSYSGTQSVEISCATENATIYYTLDGSEPSTSSTEYTGAIAINETSTLKAIAVKDGMNNSAVAIASYTIVPIYTVTLDAGNGSLNIPSNTVEGNSLTPIDLSNVTATLDNCDGWNFAGWSTSSVSETTTAPALVSNSYIPTNDITLYAVYKKTEGGSTFDATTGGEFTMFATVSNTNYYAQGTGTKLSSTTTASGATTYTFVQPEGYGDNEFAIKTGTTYLTYSSSTNLGTSTNPYKWTLSSGTRGTWRISSETSGRALIFRAGSTNQFGGYATSNISSTGTEYFDIEIGGSASTTTYNSNPVCVNLYTITATADPIEGGTVSGAGTYDDGTEITLTATASEGYTFVNWTKGGETVSSTPTCTLTVTEAAAYVANFSLNSYEITASVAPDNSGSVEGDGSYTYGSTATLTATAATGYHFVNWTEGGQEVSTEATYGFTVTSARELMANFTANEYTITYMNGEEQFTSQTYDYNAAVSAPQENPTKTGYTFAGWDPALPATMPAQDITVSAQWTINSYTITYMDGETQLNQETYEYNASVTAIADPTKEGYTFTGWNPAVPSTMPSSNVTVYAQWQINNYNLTVTQVTGGTIYVAVDNNNSVTESTTADYNALVTLTATPAENYLFSNWVVTSGETTISVENNQFNMPAGDVTVTAVFTQMDVVVTPTFTPVAGTYNDAQQVTINCVTEGASIHYTMDGSEPSTASTLYNVAVTIDQTTTLKAIAVKQGMANSNVATALYRIVPKYNVVIADNISNGTVNALPTSDTTGATITLTATPNEGYHFGEWNVTTINTPTEAVTVTNNSFLMPEGGANVSATFAINQYEVTATVDGENGSVTPTSQTVNHGETATFTATPATGYHAVWPDQSTGNTYTTATITEDLNITVSFAINQYEVTATVDGENGSVTPTSQTVNHGETATFTATPATGYHAVWPDQSTGNEYSIANITENTSITVSFAINQYEVTATVDGENGTVAPASQTVDYGGTAAFTATPVTGYHAVWPDQSTGNEYSIANITENTSITVSFAINQYEVTATVDGENGTVAPASQTVDYGGTAAFTATPATGYHAIWPDQTTGNEYSIANITENTSITVSFAINQYEVTATVDGENGTVAPVSQTVNHGETATFTATPATGYHAIWPDQSTGNEYSIANITENTSITVSFDTNTYALNVVSANETMGSANGSTTAKHFLSYQISATPNTGYHFTQWSDGNTQNPRTVTLTENTTYTAEFAINSYNLTINYKYADGTQAAATHTESVNYNAPYSVTSPVLTGYTASQMNVSGTMPAEDVNVTVTYATDVYTLTIHYVYADNTQAANDESRNLAYGTEYSVNSPNIEGYTADQLVVSGTMGEGNVEVTVRYTINSHNLTVNYVNEASAQVAESHTATLNYHDNYSVVSPQVAGYAANKSVVSGTMGDADKTETVTYYPVETSIVDATNCAGTGTGSLTVTAPLGSFEYSLDGVTFQTETQFANLNAGDYTLYIRPTGEDYNYSGVWTVNSNITMPVAVASANPFYCLDNEINLSGNGSSTGSEYTYAWSGPNNFTANGINAMIATAGDAHSGTYTLAVTNTVTNCVSEATVDVIVNTPNMNGYLFTIATHGDAYANLVGGQATPVFATPTVQHYLADAGCNVTLSNDAQATYEEAGDYTITWTATDACGNTATTTQVLHIVLGTCPVAADVDGNTYPVVALNNLCWMAANLRTTHYSDGRLIPNPMVYTSVMYPDATANLDMFGYLYDWTAAMDAANGLVQDADGNVQGICPDGWRMPKENEIRALVNDGVSDIFDLRTTDQWLNNFGTNTTGFSLLPAGCYNANSDRFENLHGDAYIWGVGASAPAQPRVFWADCKCYNWQILDTTTPMGYSVRCVRNN